MFYRREIRVSWSKSQVSVESVGHAQYLLAGYARVPRIATASVALGMLR